MTLLSAEKIPTICTEKTETIHSTEETVLTICTAVRAMITSQAAKATTTYRAVTAAIL